MLADSQGRGLIIWPIAVKLFQSVMLQTRPRWTGGRGITVGSMRHAGIRPTLPWDDSDRPPSINYDMYNLPPNANRTVSRNFALCALNIRRENLSEVDNPHIGVQYGMKGLTPAVVHPLKPMPTEVRALTGIAKDSTLTILPNAIVNLFRIDYDSGNNKIYTHIGKAITDSTGAYTFFVNRTSKYRVTADKSDLTTAGISFDTLSA
jgi:hypothetical protein